MSILLLTTSSVYSLRSLENILAEYSSPECFPSPHSPFVLQKPNKLLFNFYIINDAIEKRFCWINNIKHFSINQLLLFLKKFNLNQCFVNIMTWVCISY